MKGIAIVVLVALAIVLTVFLLKEEGPGEKSYPEKLTDARTRALNVSLEAQLNHIKAALDRYYMDNDQYPEALDMLVPQYIKTEDQLLDPWGNRLEIQTGEEMNVVLVSPGKDRVSGTSDDIRRRI